MPFYLDMMFRITGTCCLSFHLAFRIYSEESLSGPFSVHSHEIMLELVPYNFLMLMFWSLVFELLKLI